MGRGESSLSLLLAVRCQWRSVGSKSVTAGVSHCHMSVTRNWMCVCLIFIGRKEGKALRICVIRSFLFGAAGVRHECLKKPRPAPG
jgi:hypothetical protein